MNNLLTNTLEGIKFRSPYVFCSKDGKPYSSVRHSFASYLVMLGVDLITVKQLLGHKTFKMAFRYAYLSPSHKRKAIESLEYFDGHRGGHQNGLERKTRAVNSFI